MSRRIFLLEDHAELREMLASVLKKMGFEVIQAATSTAALARLRAEKFDYLVTDLRMEEMSGAELLRELEREKISVRGVLVMSAAELSELKPQDQKTILKYCPVLLRKPFTAQELAGAIERMGGAKKMKSSL